jgi:hypothetical protein
VYFFLPDDPGLELDDDPLLPLGAMPEFEIFGFPPRLGNDAHPGDVYDALEAELAGQNSEALYYGLTGAELEETTTVTTGHRHNEERTHLDWISPLRVGFASAGGGGAVYVNQTSLTTLGWGVLAIPAGHLTRPVVFSRVRVKAVGGVRVFFEMSFYPGISGSSINLGGAAAVSMITAEGRGLISLHRWYEGGPIELAGIPANMNGRYLVYVRFRAAVDTGEAYVGEAALGWKPGA